MRYSPRASGAARWFGVAASLVAIAAAAAIAVAISTEVRPSGQAAPAEQVASEPAQKAPLPRPGPVPDSRPLRPRVRIVERDETPPAAEDQVAIAAANVRSLIAKMRDEANALAAATGTTPSQGLAKYAEAEDFIRQAVLDAKRARSADEQPFTETYKTLLQESDAYSKRVITKEFIESKPWKDLLDAEMAPKWSKTTTIPGFSCSIENGVLTVTPPDAGTKMMGVCGILDLKSDNLRHCMLDMEFAVDGIATMYFRVSPPPQSPDNRQSETYDLTSTDGMLKANVKHHLVATYIGSDLTVSFPEDDEIQRYENSPAWHKLRRGGIGFLIPEGTRLTITRMRIRELR